MSRLLLEILWELRRLLQIQPAYRSKRRQSVRVSSRVVWNSVRNTRWVLPAWCGYTTYSLYTGCRVGCRVEWTGKSLLFWLRFLDFGICSAHPNVGAECGPVMIRWIATQHANRTRCGSVCVNAQRFVFFFCQKSVVC